MFYIGQYDSEPNSVEFGLSFTCALQRWPTYENFKRSKQMLPMDPQQINYSQIELGFRLITHKTYE